MITPQQKAVLRALVRGGPATVNTVAEGLLLPLRGVRNSLRALQRRELVERVGLRWWGCSYAGRRVASRGDTRAVYDKGMHLWRYKQKERPDFGCQRCGLSDEWKWWKVHQTWQCDRCGPRANRPADLPPRRVDFSKPAYKREYLEYYGRVYGGR